MRQSIEFRNTVNLSKNWALQFYQPNSQWFWPFLQEATQTRIQFVPDDPKLTDRGCYIIGPKDGKQYTLASVILLILGCLKAQEEVLEIVKKKMEEVGSTNAPVPKVRANEKYEV